MRNFLPSLPAFMGGIPFFQAGGTIMVDVFNAIANAFNRLRTPPQRIIGPHESTRFPRFISRRSLVRKQYESFSR